MLFAAHSPTPPPHPRTVFHFAHGGRGSTELSLEPFHPFSPPSLRDEPFSCPVAIRGADFISHTGCLTSYGPLVAASDHPLRSRSTFPSARFFVRFQSTRVRYLSSSSSPFYDFGSGATAAVNADRCRKAVGKLTSPTVATLSDPIPHRGVLS